MQQNSITLLVPVFNEEDNIVSFYEAVRGCAALKAYAVNILFVNDGSSDNTEEEIKLLQKNDPFVSLRSFSENQGKEAALLAGLESATGDAVIPIDVDLQDPIEVIPEFITKWEEGYEVVLGKRRSRPGDGVIKCFFAASFYRIYNVLCTPHIVPNVGDFRLISAYLIPNIIAHKGHHLFMKGLLSFAGGKEAIVEYDRPARAHGTSKQSPLKLIRLALNGILAYSNPQLRRFCFIFFHLVVWSGIFKLLIFLSKDLSIVLGRR